MTKVQAWVLIVLVGAGIVLLMIRNQNDSQKAVNNSVACQNVCYDSYTKSPQDANATDTLHKCVNQCNLSNI